MKFKKSIATSLLCGALLLTTGFATGFSINALICPDISIKVDGKEQTFTNANGTIVYPISYNGVTYLPVRSVGKLAGKTVLWDSDNRVISLNSANYSATTQNNPSTDGTNYYNGYYGIPDFGKLYNINVSEISPEGKLIYNLDTAEKIKDGGEYIRLFLDESLFTCNQKQVSDTNMLLSFSSKTSGATINMYTIDHTWSTTMTVTLSRN